MGNLGNYLQQEGWENFSAAHQRLSRELNVKPGDRQAFDEAFAGSMNALEKIRFYYGT